MRKRGFVGRNERDKKKERRKRKRSRAGVTSEEWKTDEM